MGMGQGRHTAHLHSVLKGYQENSVDGLDEMCCARVALAAVCPQKALARRYPLLQHDSLFIAHQQRLLQ